MKEKIRIANAGGFWGDDLKVLKRQLEGGPLDYISADYLAEITMSILKKQQNRNPELGYVTDFVDQIEESAELILDKDVCILSNAGGINPEGCAREIQKRLEKKGIQLKIAVIEGDNITDRLNDWFPETEQLSNMETGERFDSVKDKIQSANAYLGIPPLLKALEAKPNIIIAGRVTDTSITMAPMIHEFGWAQNDWDKLASGLVAGHIIECGAQGGGGNFTDWEKIETWTNFGYPIVEAYPNGSFIVTKHDNTGGYISAETVKEQLVYEMGDPANYISPDVVADFRTIHVEDAGENKVKISGIKGRPSTPFLKVSMAYEDGYKAVGSIILSGGNALQKAILFSDIFWQRLGIEFEKTNTEFVGYNACHLNLAQEIDPNEILLRFSVYDHDKEKLSEFGKSIAPLILSGPPGVAVTGGRPRPQQVMSYYPTLISKENIRTKVRIVEAEGTISSESEQDALSGFESDSSIEDSHKQISSEENKAADIFNSNLQGYPLKKIAYARSGDKGDTANIGVIARSEKAYDFLKEHLTAQLIQNMFSEHCQGNVIRYEMENILALNFLLEESLDGGGTKSLMIDAQGKTYAPALLNQTFPIPKDVIESINN